MKLLTPEFYLQDPLDCAQQLLGKLLVRYEGNKVLSGTIVETEAYHQTDLTSHSFKGITKRCQTMFETGGRAYVYLIYGMYYCFNVVTEKEGIGSAVLIRAIEPVQGREDMILRRKSDKDILLTNGPGKMCRALNVKKDFDGVDLRAGDLKIFDADYSYSEWVQTTRIGLREKTPKPYRFYIKDNPYVSYN